MALNQTIIFPSLECLNFLENSADDDANVKNCTGFDTTQTDTSSIIDMSPDSDSKSLVDDATRFYFEVSVQVFANLLISLFGTAANVVNIIVYVKLGLGDVVNVSLLGLAVSDLLSVLLVVWLSICYGLILLDPPGLFFDPMTFMYVTAGWPHFIFSRVTCYITAMVSIERCLCVILPFKVKEIITPFRIKLCLLLIFTVFPASYIPVLMVHKLAWKWDSNHNETRIMADFTEDREHVQATSYYINDLFLPTVSILVVTICAFITARALRQNAEWKKEKNIGLPKTKTKTKPINTSSGTSVTSGDDDNTNTSTSNEKMNSTKEMKVVRMLTVICVMFIVCYSPSVILLYIRLVYPEVAMYRTYHNLFICVYSLVFLLEISNSSFNIFIYYTMSTKYRETFQEMFSGFPITKLRSKTQR